MPSARTSRLSLLLIALVLLVLGCLATSAAQSDSNPEHSNNDGYPIVIGGHTIAQIYEPLGAFSAEERAQRGSERLTELASGSDDVADIKTIDEPYGTEIVLGDRILAVVSDADAGHTGLPRQKLAGQLTEEIRDTILLVRHEHSRGFLLRATIYAILTAAAYVVLIWLVIVGTRRLIHRLETATASRLKGLKIQRAEILAGSRITQIITTALRLFRVVLIFNFSYLLLAAEFSYFPWTRAHSELLLSYVTSPLHMVAHALLNYLPNLIYIVIIGVVMYYVVRFFKFLAREVEHENIRIPNFYPEWAQPTYKIVRLLLFAFAMVVVFPYLPGSQSPAFKGIGIFLGVLFSLGSTSAISNLVAGTILTYTRGFRIGDWVKIGDNMGEVENQSLLATHLRTIKNEEVTIPSSVVLSSHVINYSRRAKTEGLVLYTSVTIGYDAPWRTVHQLLIEAAGKTKYILQSPAPFVLQNALNDSYVEYQINAYTDRPLEMVFIYSDLHANIQDCFYAGGVEIMSPVFHALRDGNKTAIPSEFLPADYRPPSFRVEEKRETAGGAGA